MCTSIGSNFTKLDNCFDSSSRQIKSCGDEEGTKRENTRSEIQWGIKLGEGASSFHLGSSKQESHCSRRDLSLCRVEWSHPAGPACSPKRPDEWTKSSQVPWALGLVCDSSHSKSSFICFLGPQRCIHLCPIMVSQQLSCRLQTSFPLVLFRWAQQPFPLLALSAEL